MSIFSNRLGEAPDWLRRIGPALESVDLIGNNLTFVGNDAFTGLSGLTLLNLGDNPITAVSAHAFRGLDPAALQLRMEARPGRTQCSAVDNARFECTCASGFAGNGTYCVDQDLFDTCVAAMPADGNLLCEFAIPQVIRCYVQCVVTGEPLGWQCRKEYGLVYFTNTSTKLSCPAPTTTSTPTTGTTASDAEVQTAGSSSSSTAIIAAAVAAILVAVLAVLLAIWVSRRRRAQVCCARKKNWGGGIRKKEKKKEMERQRKRKQSFYGGTV